MCDKNSKHFNIILQIALHVCALFVHANLVFVHFSSSFIKEETRHVFSKVTNILCWQKQRQDSFQVLKISWKPYVWRIFLRSSVPSNLSQNNFLIYASHFHKIFSWWFPSDSSKLTSFFSKLPQIFFEFSQISFKFF